MTRAVQAGGQKGQLKKCWGTLPLLDVSMGIAGWGFQKTTKPPRSKWSYPPGLPGWGFNTPPTPRVVSYPLRPPPINWFQKGNKKPRVVGGVQILKDKRLG